MESQSDREAYFSSMGFAEDAIYKGAGDEENGIRVIPDFTDGAIEIDGEFISEFKTILLLESACPNISRNHIINVRGVDLYVDEFSRDGFGIIEVSLKYGPS